MMVPRGSENDLCILGREQNICLVSQGQTSPRNLSYHTYVDDLRWENV